jgi:membrane protein implicated in regulation of membrane protease activity
VTGRMFWPAIVVLVIGVFMLVAGIGPLWLPILIVLVGAVAAVMSKRSLRQERRS